MFDHAKQNESLMKTAKVGAGLRGGDKKFERILVFTSRKRLGLFVTTRADVAASVGAKTIGLNLVSL